MVYTMHDARSDILDNYDGFKLHLDPRLDWRLMLPFLYCVATRSLLECYGINGNILCVCVLE